MEFAANFDSLHNFLKRMRKCLQGAVGSYKIVEYESSVCLSERSGVMGRSVFLWMQHENVVNVGLNGADYGTSA